MRECLPVLRDRGQVSVVVNVRGFDACEDCPTDEDVRNLMHTISNKSPDHREQRVLRRRRVGRTIAEGEEAGVVVVVLQTMTVQPG